MTYRVKKSTMEECIAPSERCGSRNRMLRDEFASTRKEQGLKRKSGEALTLKDSSL